jgi:hypothetical protein
MEAAACALPLPSHFQKKNIFVRDLTNNTSNIPILLQNNRSNQIIMAQQFEQVVVKVDEFMAKYPTITFYGECVCHGNKHKN